MNGYREGRLRRERSDFGVSAVTEPVEVQSNAERDSGMA
jgi:hypothetical protein